METEYIERKVAMRAARHAWGKGLEPSQYIEIIPAADVAPVVRCEHCVHSYDDIGGRCCIYADGPVKDDFFCCYGERNEVILGGLEAGGG